MRREYLSYAKFNLYLAVLGQREDGYHEIDTVLQTIDLADRIIFEPLSEKRLEVICASTEVPSGRGNLVWRALDLLRQETGMRAGMRVEIQKRIPTQAGLGGGSSNAACALAVGNLLWDIGLSDASLEQIGARIGSDVPFFVRGGTQRCRGRGERLEPLIPLPDSLWLVVTPNWGNATADVYARIGSSLTPYLSKVNIVLESIAKRALASVVENGFNDLEGPAGEFQPGAAGLRAWMSEAGLVGIRLAGSGSSWVGYCPDSESVGRVQSKGRDRGWDVVAVRPTERGWSEGQGPASDGTWR